MQTGPRFCSQSHLVTLPFSSLFYKPAGFSGSTHSWTKSQNPVRNWIENFVKLTDHTSACNDLTNFGQEVRVITGNGYYVNLLENYLNKFMKSHQVNLILAGFKPFGITVQWHTVGLTCVRQPLKAAVLPRLACGQTDQQRPCVQQLVVLGWRPLPCQPGICNAMVVH